MSSSDHSKVSYLSQMLPRNSLLSVATLRHLANGPSHLGQGTYWDRGAGAQTALYATNHKPHWRAWCLASRVLARFS